ncbi:MAG: hypothetical protein ACFHWX_00010 [Bacteroidota bacterium]
MNKDENELWDAYVMANKHAVPSNLQDKVWTSIRRKKQQRQRVLVAPFIAASIALLIFFLIPIERGQTEAEKSVLLQEALSMFPDEDQIPNEEDILYEDDIIIIYVKTTE